MCGTGNTVINYNCGTVPPNLLAPLYKNPSNYLISTFMPPPSCGCNGRPGPFVHGNGCTSVFSAPTNRYDVEIARSDNGVSHHALNNDAMRDMMDYKLAKKQLKSAEKFGWFDRIVGLFTGGGSSAGNNGGGLGNLLNGLLGGLGNLIGGAGGAGGAISGLLSAL